jgi:uncharacterized damage-inducible protein DinB
VDRLEELIASIPQALWTRRTAEGWTIQQHVGHLSDLEELHDGRLDDYDARAEILRPADVQNRKTEAARHDEAAMSDLLGRFRAVRAAFVARLDDMSHEDAGRSALHPRLNQPMRVIDMAVFVADHDDHHLARIRELGGAER